MHTDSAAGPQPRSAHQPDPWRVHWVHVPAGNERTLPAERGIVNSAGNSPPVIPLAHSGGSGWLTRMQYKGVLYKNFTRQGQDCGGNCGGTSLKYNGKPYGTLDPSGWFVVPHPTIAGAYLVSSFFSWFAHGESKDLWLTLASPYCRSGLLSISRHTPYPLGLLMCICGRAVSRGNADVVETRRLKLDSRDFLGLSVKLHPTIAKGELACTGVWKSRSYCQSSERDGRTATFGYFRANKQS